MKLIDKIKSKFTKKYAKVKCLHEFSVLPIIEREYCCYTKSYKVYAIYICNKCRLKKKIEISEENEYEKELIDFKRIK